MNFIQMHNVNVYECGDWKDYEYLRCEYNNESLVQHQLERGNVF